MSAGPTQNYDDASLGSWRPRPGVALGVQVLIVVGPVLVAVGLGLLVVRLLPAERLGLPTPAWLLLQVALTAGVVAGSGRILRRLAPLSALLRLTLVFPDRAPSRMAVALRAYSPAVLRRRIDQVRRRGDLGPDIAHGEDLLALVGAIAMHDQLTHGHSERVQAYTALIARELGLDEQQVAGLSWAALLHDVGKLSVPAQILSARGRPTPEQWRILKSHPEAGMRLAAPLQGWLGPWLGAIGQHHERWDGGGYPYGLVGTQISLAARIVAVADTFDAITSARSYKEALSPAAARDEIARCAGSQFDPDVVRAFMAVGLPRLERVALPLAFLSVVPVLRHLPSLSGSYLAPSVASGALYGSTSSVVVSALLGCGITLATPGFALADGTDSANALSTPAVVDTSEPSPISTPGAAIEASEAAAVEASPDLDAAGVLSASAAPQGQAGPVPDDAADQPQPAAAQAQVQSSTPSGTTSATGGDASTASAPAASSTPSTAATTDCARARAGGTSMRHADLAGCDLSGLTLTGYFTGADLSGAKLAGSTVWASSLVGANLDGADLTGAHLQATSLVTASMVGADLSGAEISDVSLHAADLTGARLDGAQITRTDFAGATTTGASAVGALWEDVSCAAGSVKSAACF